ncbi:MAG: hypothetical protein C0422_06425, partial [Alcaligenaceae bacterium]|nr:hypothetical protein [Alcaligenaceae bacterium]
RKSGWELNEPEEFPAYDNTPVWHEALKKCAALSTHWNAGKLYQLMIVITCYEDTRYPDNKGYLVTSSRANTESEYKQYFACLHLW